MLPQHVRGSHFTLNHIECCKHVSYHETFQVLQTTGSGPALRMTVCDVYVPAGWLQSVFKVSEDGVTVQEGHSQDIASTSRLSL